MRTLGIIKPLFRFFGILALSGIVGGGLAIAQSIQQFTIQTLNGPYAYTEHQGKTLVFFFSFPG